MGCVESWYVLGCSWGLDSGAKKSRNLVDQTVESADFNDGLM